MEEEEDVSEQAKFWLLLAGWLGASAIAEPGWRVAWAAAFGAPSQQALVVLGGGGSRGG